MVGIARQLTNLSNQLSDSSKKGRKALEGGYAEASPFLENATRLFDPILADQQQGFDMYQNSLGLNGQEGYDAAVGAYQQSPGYQFALDQANQNILRNNSALGGVASGNTLIGLSDRAREMQNLDYGNWQNRLAGFDPMRAATAQGSALSNQGTMRYGLGKDIAGNYQSQANNLLGLGQMQLQNSQFQQQQDAQNSPWNMVLGGLGALSGFLGA